jgi:hypothetical protein
MRNSPKINLFLFALIAVLLASAGCVSLFLHGKVKDKTYTATAGLFSCPVPDLLNVKIQDWAAEEKMYVTTGGVSFVSWVGVYRIDYIVARKAPVQDELNRMLSTQLDWYRKIPSTNVYVLYQKMDGERMFAVLVAPKGNLGSFITSDGKHWEHADLSRAMLIFKHGYYIYAVSADAMDIGAKSDDKSPKRINWLRQKVDEFADSIKFSRPEVTN